MPFQAIVIKRSFGLQSVDGVHKRINQFEMTHCINISHAKDRSSWAIQIRPRSLMVERLWRHVVLLGSCAWNLNVLHFIS
jgi:hypothetical protein